MDAGPFRKSSEFASQADAATVPGKSWTKNVGHLHKLRAFTNRTLALDRPTDFACRSNEFRMCIAHLAVVENAPSVVSQN
jgi:hypothetical protein